MAIISDLNIKMKSRASKKTFKYGDIPEGVYKAVFDFVYPWKSITKDTKVWLRDNDGVLVKDEDGNRIEVDASNVTWYSTDVVFTIKGGEFDGISAKYYLSTHPNFHGSKMQFLYRLGVINDLTVDGILKLEDLYKYTGKEVDVFIKHKTITVKDKDTGLSEDKVIPYVSYVLDPKDVPSVDGDEIEGL